jgi:hypothetical protein
VKLDVVARRDTVERLAGLLDQLYVTPETGRLYAARLRELNAAGAYDDLEDPAAFGARVTADLQAMAPDRHLRLAPTAGFFGPRRPLAADEPKSTAPSGPEALEAAQMIGDVAYLRFNQFPEEGEAAAKARAFLVAHADARAVIIDARPLRGGGLSVMDAVLPLFFGQPTQLLRMDTRAEAETVEPLEAAPSLVRQPSPPDTVRQDHEVTPDPAETRLRQTPLYYLTSRRTASAGEHLALALKRTHRATLIGERTIGAGHYGRLLELPHGFSAFVPFGRTYDPDTGEDWEGRGVEPDIQTHADDALDLALARIGPRPSQTK